MGATSSTRKVAPEPVTFIEGKKEVKCYNASDNYYLKSKEFYEQNKGDIIIRSKSHEFQVHSQIISISSPLFASILSYTMEEKKSGVIDYSTYPDEILDKFLRYIYYRAAILEEKEMSLEDLGKILLLVELFDMHMLDEAKEILMNKIHSTIEKSDLSNLCILTNFFSVAPSSISKYYTKFYKKSLHKLLFIIKDRAEFITLLKKNYINGKAGAVNCYDNLPRGEYGRPHDYEHYLCCAHVNIHQHHQNLKKENVTLTCNKSSKICCISYNLSNKEIPLDAEKRYCCSHRSNIPEEVLQFEKKVNIEIDLNERVKADLINELFSFISGLQYSSD